MYILKYIKKNIFCKQTKRLLLLNENIFYDTKLSAVDGVFTLHVPTLYSFLTTPMRGYVVSENRIFGFDFSIS